MSTLERSAGRDWVNVVVPVSKAEELLDAEYSIWEHTESGERVVRTMKYSLPESVHEHGKHLSYKYFNFFLSSLKVHLVTPTTMFGSPRPHKATFHYSDRTKFKTAGVAASCNNTITISCLQALYKTGTHTENATIDILIITYILATR